MIDALEKEKLEHWRMTSFRDRLRGLEEMQKIVKHLHPVMQDDIRAGDAVDPMMRRIDGETIHSAKNSHQTASWVVREDGRGWANEDPVVIGISNRQSMADRLRWNEDIFRLLPVPKSRHKRGIQRFKTWEDKEKWDNSHRMD